MTKKKKKYYVVWQGKVPGVYTTWEDCKQQVDGYTGARYKSFSTETMAQEAYASGYMPITTHLEKKTTEKVGLPEDISISVDAACSGNPGKMEYRGVWTINKQEIFHLGPLEMGTNNIGEFLALVHALAYQKQKNWNYPIYTDSLNAMAWVRKKKCGTKMKRTVVNAQIFNLIERAENWLRNNSYTTPIRKWNTPIWGEIPADFGRK